jgi:hypothetical protein
MTSLPQKRTSPLMVAEEGSSRRSERAVTDFPDPLSPTMASRSPARTSRSTPRTA